MVKLLFFDMLQKVAEPIDDATKDFWAAFVHWLNKIRIVSCDLDEDAVNYSRNTVARKQVNPESSYLSRLTSECCKGRELLSRLKSNIATAPCVVIESSICGDFMIILELVYYAIHLNVSFLIIDWETMNANIHPLFTSWRQFTTRIESHTMPNWKEAEQSVDEHVKDIMAIKSLAKLNKKMMALINVNKMRLTWVKGLASREAAERFVIKQMVLHVLSKQNNAMIRVQAQRNKSGRDPLKFEAIAPDTSNYMNRTYKLIVSLNEWNPLNPASSVMVSSSVIKCY